MGVLSPLFLFAAAALAVPLVLHLLHRDRRREIVFPALRYLQRTERDHARDIRMRQWLLLALRCLAIMLLVLAGARLVVGRAQGSHPPTAIVVVLDNSMSTQRVMGDERVFDRLRRQALEGLAAATPEDRIWVLRAAHPLETVRPLDIEAARARLEATRPSDGRGDLAAALRHARALIADADLETGEIHLISDLQRSAFDADPLPPADALAPVPVLVATGLPPAEGLHAIAEVSAGDGLPPLRGERTAVSVRLADLPGSEPTSVRLYVDGEVQGALQLDPGTAGALGTPPLVGGWLTGWIEADADALRADDRRWFVTRTLAPPQMAPPPATEPFLTLAVQTLVDAGRARPADAGQPDVAWLPEAQGLAALGGIPGIVLPPRDPSRLPALNRRLADAGILWRYDAARGAGMVRRVRASSTPVPLEGVEIRAAGALLPAAPTPANPGGSMPLDGVLAQLDDGSAWLVSARTRAGAPVLLLAHPFDEASTSLPTSSAMVPLVEWMLAGWGQRTSGRGRFAGEPLPLPTAADSVELPDGTRVATDGTSLLSQTHAAGIYTALRADSVLDRYALNPPAQESDLTPVEPSRLETLVGPGARAVPDDAWAEAPFVRRRGFEAWPMLALLALALLALESWLAASGRAGRTRARSTPQGASPTSL